MRVLMLAWEFPPRSVGGIAAHVDGLSQALAGPGHDVVLFTLAHPGAPADSEVGDVRVLRARTDLPWLPDDDLVARVASANHHLVQLVDPARRLGRPDVVHAHDWQVAWAADTLATLHDAPLVATFHATERGRHGGRVPPGEPSTIHAVESWLAHDADEVVASSRFMVSEVIDGFELPAERTHLIPNGIDPTWWATGESPRRPHAARVHVGPGPVREGVPGAGPGDAPAALAGARRSSASSAGAGSYLPELQSQIDLEGVSDLVAPARLPARRPAARHACTAPGASSSRRSTSRSASSPSRRWPAARRSSSPAPAGWPS